MIDIKTQLETLLSVFCNKRTQDIIDDPLSTDELEAPLDSISAVDVLVGIYKLVQFKLPVEKIIRHGSYSSKDQFVTDITDKVLRHLKEVAK